MKKQKFKNPITQKYYHQLYKSFPLHNLHEKEFLKLIKIRLHEYENSHLEATYQDYIERFGLPEDIIVFFYQHYDDHYVITHMKSRKIIKYSSFIIVPLIIISLVYVLWTTYHYYQDYKNMMESFSDYEEEIIYDYGTISMDE